MALMNNRSYDGLDSMASTVNIKQSFDLNGINNDELLCLYLRKAGLSDHIECLTPEQRRAFIYDIVKSNLPPGQWQPSTMKAATVPHLHTRPLTRPSEPPPALHVRHASGPITQFPKSPMGSKSSSTNSLKTLSISGSPKLPPRFIPAPQTPPSPSTFVTNAAGKTYEISGPTQFRHISGDITRDRTRHAFDLSCSMNDNVLRKYLFENGITEDDVKDIPRQELIYKIVQSKFRWMPPKHQQSKENFTEISISFPSPQPSTTSFSSWSSTSTSASNSPTKAYTPNQTTNFELVAWRFNEPSSFPAPQNLTSAVESKQLQEPTRKQSIAVKVKSIPAPPPRKSKDLPPPPRPPTTIENENYHDIDETYEKPDYDQPSDFEMHNYMDVIPNPPPLPPTLQRKTPEEYETPSPVQEKDVFSVLHMPVVQQDECAKPPKRPPQAPPQAPLHAPPKAPPQPPLHAPPQPPPPPPLKPNKKLVPVPMKNMPDKFTDDGDSRDALMQSIRNGINLKKVSPNKKAATISSTKLNGERKGHIDLLSELKMGITLRNSKLNDESCA